MARSCRPRERQGYPPARFAWIPPMQMLQNFAHPTHCKNRTRIEGKTRQVHLYRRTDDAGPSAQILGIVGGLKRSGDHLPPAIGAGRPSVGHREAEEGGGPAKCSEMQQVLAVGRLDHRADPRQRREDDDGQMEREAWRARW